MNLNHEKTAPTVTAVVVTYRSSKTIADTLESMKRSYDAGVLKCIVVDNNSSDETVDILKNYGSWAMIIENSDNVGFGRACNRASPWNTLLQETPLIKARGRRHLYPGEKLFKTDLCRRILDEGAEIWCVGEAVAYHIGAASSDETSDAKIGDCIAEHYFQSRFYYFLKHHGIVMAVVAELGEIFLLGIRALAAKILNRGDTSAFYTRIQGPVLKLPPKVQA